MNSICTIGQSLVTDESMGHHGLLNLVLTDIIRAGIRVNDTFPFAAVVRVLHAPRIALLT